VFADEPSPKATNYSYLSDNYDFHAGVFFPQLETEILVNSDPSLPGTLINLEKNFGLPNRQTRGWFEFNYRSSSHSTIRFIYFDTDRSGTNTIGQDIHFGERTFTAPAEVRASNSTRYYWLSYQILILRNVYNEFGISPGIMVADVTSSLTLKTAAPQNIDRTKEIAFIAPIPILGLYLSSQFLPRTFLRNTIRVLDITMGDYAASLFNYTITVDYNPYTNWGIGAGYFFNRLEITKGFINFNGSYIANSNGLELYLKYFFS
jgi:hypothetical protein